MPFFSSNFGNLLHTGRKSELKRGCSYQQGPRERLHELKKGLFSALQLSGLLNTGAKLELKTGLFKAHVNAP